MKLMRTLILFNVMVKYHDPEIGHVSYKVEALNAKEAEENFYKSIDSGIIDDILSVTVNPVPKVIDSVVLKD